MTFWFTNLNNLPEILEQCHVIYSIKTELCNQSLQKVPLRTLNNDVDLPGLSVKQNNRNDESDIMPIITIEERLTFPFEDGRTLKK